MGSKSLSASQHSAFLKLVEANTRFCRLGLANLDDPSRGLSSMHNILSYLEANDEDLQSFSPENLIVGAKPVDPDRIKVPANAGSVDPARILKGRRRAAFLNPDSKVKKRSPPKAELPRGFYNVPRRHRDRLTRTLLETKMAVLIRESDVARTEEGDLILAGLFTVAHKKLLDRLIFDRRPQNYHEYRYQWARLPLGPQLCRILLDSKHGLRGSGDDLRTYFYQLKQCSRALSRNAFGERIWGDDFLEFGGEPGVPYRLALAVVAMGDLNAVDVAQAVHEQVLEDGGCLAPGTVLHYGEELPDSCLLEGVYIDDHLVIHVCLKSQLKATEGPDKDVILASHKAYVSSGLPRSEEKGFGFAAAGASGTTCAETNFTAWGTEVNQGFGSVGTPWRKRFLLWILTLFQLSQKRSEQSVVKRLTALYVHPFMHRRECFSCWHRVFKWLSNISPGQVVAVPPDIRDEIAVASLIIPIAYTNIRAPVSNTITTTDATPDRGGATACDVQSEICNALWRMTEYKGEHVRLDQKYFSETNPPASANPEAALVVDMLPWRVSNSHNFKRRAHINAQELLEVLELLKRNCNETLDMLRLVNGVDSKVVLGCWAKGRSSSFVLNGLLRKGLAWSLFGWKFLSNYWLPTDRNPSDHPSRNRPLPPAPKLEASVAARVLLKPPAPASPVVKGKVKKCVEAYGGCGLLTQSMSDAGLQVDVPYEAYPAPGVYRRDHDLTVRAVIRKLKFEIVSGLIAFIHFGLPCTTWTTLTYINGGTRRVWLPEGDGSLGRENIGNLQASLCARLCVLVREHGGHFSIENPKGSLLWKSKYIKHITSHVATYFVSFDQCAYGLSVPGFSKYEFCRKSTSVLASFPSIRRLEARCPGVSRYHRHRHVLGSVKIEGKWQSVAKLAGRYPIALTQVWAQAIADGIKGKGYSPRAR